MNKWKKWILALQHTKNAGGLKYPRICVESGAQRCIARHCLKMPIRF
ncbi:hypothetical protein [Helicobacter sp. MIT 05-5293]|nr:hypothetical protein [Helicobacter sp. MIT 05-5293]